MDNLLKPELSILQKGERHKVMRVTGAANAQMPLHYSTKEAVIHVEQGEALLTMGSILVELKPGSCQVIPARQPHTLLITKDFQAVVIMEIDSEIKFTHIN